MWYVKFNKTQEIKRWTKWFAWYPVSVFEYPDGSYKKIWLIYVQRCGHYGCYSGLHWNYREIKD